MKRFLASAVMLYLAVCSYSQGLRINGHEYFEMPGLNVMVFYDIYPEGHQGAIGIIQNGTRVATNGDLRLEPTPGQWQPIPKVGKRTAIPEKNEVNVVCWYPDSAINRKGFNPIIYPDLSFVYKVRVIAEGTRFRILVDLNEKLPPEWEKQVGFNLELFPGLLFGKSWYMDGRHGLFNTQPNGPMEQDLHGAWQAAPMATGRKLTIAPDEPAQLMKIESFGQPLQLLDGRFYHNNGWYVVRSLVTPGKTKGAIEWVVDANVLPDFISKPVVHVSQVGYHPDQEKIVVVELDGSLNKASKIELIRYTPEGEQVTERSQDPESWGKFLRFNYFRLNFTDVKTEGIYRVRYEDYLTEPFRIGKEVYKKDVWQPTLEYYLPVQMCHMRINEGYRVWHDLCHMDDALMAPVDTNHFDGYLQGPSTLTDFKPGDQVPGLNVGGWHDAGDYDLRVESQAGNSLGAGHGA
jgi:endoglucanase